MGRLRSWWQKALKPLGILGIIVICSMILALLVVIVIAYVFDVNVPGLHGKTLWDWMQLLIIPLVLAVIALLFQLANSRTERQIAKQRYEQDQQIALDKQWQDLLEAYLDRMSELLLKEKLRSSEVDAEVRNVARVRTITVLTQLDARRIGYVFAFLRQAGLMSKTSNDNVVGLGGANFRYVNWSQADLSKTNLSNADLYRANLSLAILYDATLSNAYLYRANLSRADLGYANLSGANLSGANLSGADLHDANLQEANVTDEQLAKAKSLKGATMPDGKIHP